MEVQVDEILATFVKCRLKFTQLKNFFQKVRPKYVVHCVQRVFRIIWGSVLSKEGKWWNQQNKYITRRAILYLRLSKYTNLECSNIGKGIVNVSLKGGEYLDLARRVK